MFYYELNWWIASLFGLLLLFLLRNLLDAVWLVTEEEGRVIELDFAFEDCL